jgi:branched-chain amino acid transport system substrate-binding protein
MGKLSTLLLSAALTTAVVTGASAQEQVKIGMLQGFTGPTESLVKPMALGGELAI